MVKRNNFVEIGRVAIVNYGVHAHKYVVILDVVDAVSVLVDGPTSGVDRQIMPLKWLSITHIKFQVPRSVTTHTLKKFIVVNGVDAKVAACNWMKKASAAKARLQMTDFDRYKVAQLKKQKAAIVRKFVKA
jgi:large subunit ribosomal protein L14e|eukprot:TRINITY_DN54043_c0_g1_i1.p1 TRINITY_DN54043_c0_g1~~TRINITY_DN54043_c0_g1_i1.p1  ORF type:complete len:131 (-),score=29.68 TRINITY_DN54043_c0_g1_i1:55-447(-)